ncbi:MAG TPA: hypothetical protein VFE24_05265 [Pirellulales bacterium]|jgi:hypothetical protein|nr:hypothetical protein [Pirellulales bacterium]
MKLTFRSGAWRRLVIVLALGAMSLSLIGCASDPEPKRPQTVSDFIGGVRPGRDLKPQ